MPHISLREELYGITSLLDYKPNVAAPLCALTDLLLTGSSTLSQYERELIAMHVSQRNECVFCAAAHGAIACALPGGSEELTNAVKNNPEAAPVSAKMKALLHLAGKVQQGGHLVGAADTEAARQAGASDLEIHDTVLIAALFCLYNRYVDGLATVAPADPAFYQALGERIAGRGYAMPADGYHALPHEPTSQAS